MGLSVRPLRAEADVNKCRVLQGCPSPPPLGLNGARSAPTPYASRNHGRAGFVREDSDTPSRLAPILAPMALEVTGRLHKLYEAQSVTDRFTKREFVLELTGRYPQFVLFQLTGKHCADLDAFAVGDSVRVTFSLRGREWTSRQGEVKYFNSLDVSKLERVDAPKGDAPPSPAAAAAVDDEEPPF